MAAIRMTAPRRGPSMTAAVAYNDLLAEEQEHARRVGGSLDHRDLAERLYDRGVEAGRAAGALSPDVAAVVAGLRAGLAGGDSDLRAACEAALEDLTRPPQRANAETGSPTAT